MDAKCIIEDGRSQSTCSMDFGESALTTCQKPSVLQNTISTPGCCHDWNPPLGTVRCLLVFQGLAVRTRRVGIGNRRQTAARAAAPRGAAPSRH